MAKYNFEINIEQFQKKLSPRACKRCGVYVVCGVLSYAWTFLCWGWRGQQGAGRGRLDWM